MEEHNFSANQIPFRHTVEVEEELCLLVLLLRSYAAWFCSILDRRALYCILCTGLEVCCQTTLFCLLKMLCPRHSENRIISKGLRFHTCTLFLTCKMMLMLSNKLSREHLTHLSVHCDIVGHILCTPFHFFYFFQAKAGGFSLISKCMCLN